MIEKPGNFQDKEQVKVEKDDGEIMIRTAELNLPIFRNNDEKKKEEDAEKSGKADKRTKA